MADDYANTACPTLISWATNNSMGDADAFFSDSEVSMSDYGVPGMPKVIVVGCADHKVYYNENYTAANISLAIDEALLECSAISGIGDAPGQSNYNLKAYPNPASDQITVSYEMTESSFVTVDIIDMVGESVYNVSNSVKRIGSVEFQFDTHVLNDGFYFLRVQSKEGSQVVKLSIAH